MTADPVRPSVILLDALGTLLELVPPAPRLQVELSSRFGVEISTDQAAIALAAEIAYYRRHLDEGRDRRSLALLRGRCADALRAALPPSEALDAVDREALTAALLASLHFQPFADVRPALSAARARGQRLVVVSNWDVSLPEVLERLGLASLFAAVLTSARVGARKPDAEIFRRALALAGATAADAIHVGDSVEEDVAGAQAAGIEPILVRRTGDPAPTGVRTIASLEELGAIATAAGSAGVAPRPDP